MTSELNCQEVATGIYVYSNVGLLPEFNLLQDKIKNGKINWTKLPTNRTSEADFIILNKEESEDQKEISELFENKFKVIEQDYLSNFETEVISIDFIGREYVFALRYENIDAKHHYDDHLANHMRRVTVLYYPNDDYDGGELEFPRFNVKIKTKPDQIIIFPSCFIYDHIIHKAENGIRYVVGTTIF